MRYNQDRNILNLSAREYDVFHLVLKGTSNEKIASKHHVTIKTIEQHKHHIRKKIGCRTDYGIPGAIASKGLSAIYLRGYRKAIKWNTGYLRLSSLEVEFIQYLLYDLYIQEVLTLDKFCTLSKNTSLSGICKKADTKHYFELVAILLQHRLVKLPVQISLDIRPRLAS